MPQPNIEFWMQTRSQSRPRRSPRKSLKRDVGGSPQYSPAGLSKKRATGPFSSQSKTRSRAHKKAPTKRQKNAVANPQSQSVTEVEMGEDPGDAPLNITWEHVNRYHPSLKHTGTEVSMDEVESLLGEQYTLGDGGSFLSDQNMATRRCATNGHLRASSTDFIEQTDTKALHEDLEQFRRAHEMFLAKRGAVHPTSVPELAPSAYPVPGPIEDPEGSTISLPKLLGPTGTEILDQDELRQIWEMTKKSPGTGEAEEVTGDSRKPPFLRGSPSAPDDFTADTVAFFRNFIREQGLY